jgi:hypothetical protein
MDLLRHGGLNWLSDDGGAGRAQSSRGAWTVFFEAQALSAEGTSAWYSCPTRGIR